MNRLSVHLLAPSAAVLLAATLVLSLPGSAAAGAACCPVPDSETRATAPRNAARPQNAELGQLAPAFTLRDLNNRRRTIDEFAGRIVVLEWTNPHCPFVKRHYESGNIPGLQSRFRDSGVVWLLVQSTRTDHGQYMAPGRLTAQLGTWRSRPTATLLDPDGAVGRKYGARTTPHLYVIDRSGKLVYMGAIDDDPRGDAERVTNHVAPVVEALLAGRPVTPSSTTPYGCSVKY